MSGFDYQHLKIKPEAVSSFLWKTEEPFYYKENFELWEWFGWFIIKKSYILLINQEQNETIKT